MRIRRRRLGFLCVITIAVRWYLRYGLSYRDVEELLAERGAYLYRAVDQHGQVIDMLLSERRDLAAARRFFTRALRAGTVPAGITTDRAPAGPRDSVVHPRRESPASGRDKGHRCSKARTIRHLG